MPGTYIVECRDGTLYTGSAMDVASRIEKHNSGKGAKYLRGRLPVTLKYVEYHETWPEALKHEFSIKSMNRESKMELIRNYES